MIINITVKYSCKKQFLKMGKTIKILLTIVFVVLGSFLGVLIGALIGGPKDGGIIGTIIELGVIVAIISIWKYVPEKKKSIITKEKDKYDLDKNI